MFRILAILCLVAPAFGFTLVPLVPGLKYKFGSNAFAGVGTENLLDLPLSNRSASVRGYSRMNRPRLPGGYCDLQLWCRKDEYYRVCIFTDETGDVAGAQVNIPYSDFKPRYDMTEQGFTIWTTSLNNEIVKYYAYFIFFVSPDPEKRIESKDVTIILRDDNVHYSGFGRYLASVPTNTSQFGLTHIKQKCLLWQGHGHYYNMDEDLECSPSTLSPLSLNAYKDKLVAVKVTAFGHFKKGSIFGPLYEDVTAVSAKYAVPNGPDCLYNEISYYGAISMTIFFTSTPWRITCVV